MADAKKSKRSTNSKTKQEPVAKKPAAAVSSLINTSLAAETAARMVAHGSTAPSSTASSSAGEQSESAAFKKLKESIGKPSSQGVASFLQNSAPVKKSGQPFGKQNQTGRNQTFGADVNRSGVPRRTGGG
jgi:hypothetical protein